MYIQLEWNDHGFTTEEGLDNSLVDIEDIVNDIPQYTFDYPPHIDSNTKYHHIVEYLDQAPFMVYSRTKDVPRRARRTRRAIKTFFIINTMFDTQYIIDQIQTLYTFNESDGSTLYNEIITAKTHIRDLIIDDIIG